MIHCKKHIIAIAFTLLLPLTGWSEAAVIDDSENFAFTDGQQMAEASVGHPKYDEPMIENGQFDKNQNEYYQMDSAQSDDDGPALVKDDQNGDSSNHIDDSAKLIDKIHTLQQEIQELRGQLEVQAHDLKLLQQQQVAFYKDLDSRLGGASFATVQSKSATEINSGSKTPTTQSNAAPTSTQAAKPATAPAVAVSRVNPADEQISYLAAYELVKNKRYDNAINAMHVFVQKYPNGGYTANAQYWLGELYLVKKEYAKAIEHFEIVLHQFPASGKSAASLLKSGYAYMATGNNQEARTRFQQLIKAYPNTSTAQIARAKLQSIKTT